MHKHNRLAAYLESILSSSKIPWWEWNIKENRVTFNDLKVTNLGYKPEDYKGGKYQAFTSLIHPEDYERSMQAMKDYLYGNAALYQVDYRIRDINDKYHWYMDRGAAVARSETGEMQILRGVVIDMGENFSKEKYSENVMDVMRKSDMTFSKLKQGIVVICANCRKIEIEQNKWIPVTDTFSAAAGAEISHTICPECIKLLYPDLADEFLAG